MTNKGKNVAGKSIMEQEYGFIIDPSTVKEVKYKDYTSYTMRILTEKNDKNSFANLLIEIYNPNDIRAYILNYAPTENWLNDFYNNSASNFEGEITYQKINYNTNTANKSALPCEDFYIIYSVDCSCNNHPGQEQNTPSCSCYGVASTLYYYRQSVCNFGGGGTSTTDSGYTEGAISGGSATGTTGSTGSTGSTDSTGKPIGPITDLVLPNKIINNLTDPCAKGIFTELENGIYTENPLKPEIQIPTEAINLNFAESILKLFNDSSKSHIIIRNYEIGDVNAHTVGTIITLDDSYIKSATQLSIARTIIHETVHVYLNGIYYTIPDFENKTLQEKMEIFAKDNGFNPVTDPNKFQHNFMGQYVNAMAYSLYKWDKDYGTGGNLGWDYYYALGFGGLFQTYPDGKISTETDSFKSIIPNPVERQKIADAIFNELKNNENAKGSDCN